MSQPLSKAWYRWKGLIIQRNLLGPTFLVEEVSGIWVFLRNRETNRLTTYHFKEIYRSYAVVLCNQ